MEVEAHIRVIDGTEYVTRRDAERLLTEADNRRRLHMQEEIDSLARQLRDANTYINQLIAEREPYDPNEM